MNNFVTYQVVLTPENAELIDKVNSLLIAGYSAEPKAETEAEPKAETKAETKAEPKAETKAEPKAETKAETKAEATGPTLADVKKAAKAAKIEHGEDFANNVLDELGVKAAASLGRRMAAIGESQYAEAIAGWECGPEANGNTDDDYNLDDDLDDDGLDDDSTPPPTAEAVKTALKAYSKSVGREEAKAIMADNGAKVLSEVDNCSPEQLSAMFKLLV